MNFTRELGASQLGKAHTGMIQKQEKHLLHPILPTVTG